MTSTIPAMTIDDAGRRFPRSLALQSEAHDLIPGGAHTYAKGDDQYPVLAPGFIERGEGCHVWDVDGNEYVEYGMGLRAITLGHGYRPVVDAAYAAMLRGMNFSRPSPIEVECAREFLSVVPSAEMVKFSRNGSDCTSAAVKLARAVTGRDLVAVCGDQPFFSTDDWFIGSTSMSAGIPETVRRLTVKFRYNDMASVRDLFTRFPGQISSIVLEPASVTEPAPGYLQELRAFCDSEGALLIFDETITGFRWDLAGAQGLYGVTPDLSCFGKALANGFPVAVLAGKREIMERGGLRTDQERVFLLSTTHGAEPTGLAAAIATIRAYRQLDVVAQLYRQGQRLRDGIDQVVRAHGLSDHVGVLGRACNLVYFTRDRERRPSQALRALFMQELIRRGIIGPSFVVSCAHHDDDIDRTIDAVRDILPIYADALEGGAERHLIGRPVKPVFRPFN